MDSKDVTRKTNEFLEKLKIDPQGAVTDYLNFMEGISANEHDRISKNFYDNIIYSTKILLGLSTLIVKFDKKTNEQQAEINNAIGRIKRLEEKFDDLEKRR